MEKSNPQGMKIPIILIGVAVVVVAAGILVRSLNAPSSPEKPESEPAAEPASEPETTPLPTIEQSPQIEFSTLTATDKNDDNWRLGLKRTPLQPAEGATKAGEPLVVKADVRGAGQYITIGLIIEGQAGEVYEPGASRNGRMMPAPTFKVFDEAGKTIGSGSFEYG